PTAAYRRAPSLSRLFSFTPRRPPRSTLFPYTRSSDLLFDQLTDLAVFTHTPKLRAWRSALAQRPSVRSAVSPDYPALLHAFLVGDRKSTRLNSSHVSISYAVFCLKKKKARDDSVLSQR